MSGRIQSIWLEAQRLYVMEWQKTPVFTYKAQQISGGVEVLYVKRRKSHELHTDAENSENVGSAAYLQSGEYFNQEKGKKEDTGIGLIRQAEKYNAKRTENA